MRAATATKPPTPVNRPVITHKVRQARGKQVRGTLTPGKAFSSKDQTGVHSAHALSHIAALPADLAAAVMHRRLHISLDRIKQLVTTTADAPPCLRQAAHVHCDDCVTANATRLPHSGDNYHESHIGRVIHGDIVGPFKFSLNSHAQYMLVLVDDHSRFKFVYFLKKKSDAPKAIRKFVSKFNAHASSRSSTPVRVVGTYHSDNAGEFLSHEMSDFLDTESIDHTTCPPHVHQLNGVAERAIRSVIELTRANLTASGLATTFWQHAASHAVDVLNRTTGPPSSTKSSFEALTGHKSNIMNILPFGCRYWALKPRSFVSKTNIDTRAWAGVNLGRSELSPGAYNVWLGDLSKVVC